LVKDRINAIGLASSDDFRRDADLFYEGARTPEFRDRILAAMKHGFQNREAEMDLPKMLTNLARETEQDKN
jgi:hypothetical protein